MENTLACNLGLNNEQATQFQDSVQIKLGFANNSNSLTTCNPLHEVQSNFWQPLWPLPALWPSYRSLEDNQKSTVTNKKRRASKPISFELVRLFNFVKYNISEIITTLQLLEQVFAFGFGINPFNIEPLEVCGCLRSGAMFLTLHFRRYTLSSTKWRVSLYLSWFMRFRPCLATHDWCGLVPCTER